MCPFLPGNAWPGYWRRGVHRRARALARRISRKKIGTREVTPDTNERRSEMSASMPAAVSLDEWRAARHEPQQRWAISARVMNLVAHASSRK